ncbi:cytochrome-c peroxidase [Hymenobacter algoricola]|uniref:Cytochrome c peroxidase n=1 Tax=Hymenobacter algoricola TaxID=486267 RepID=A0ABP7MJA5_9BACT
MRTRIFYVVLLFFLTVAGWSACQRPEAGRAATAPTPAARVLADYRRNLGALDSAVARLRRSVAAGQPVGAQRRAFARARRAYKRIEFLTEYYVPSLAKQLNGPALAEVEAYDQQQRAVPAEGLQVLETYLYPAAYAPAQRAEVLAQLALVHSSLVGLHNAAATFSPTDRHLFDAVRLGVFRIVTLGLPRFDTPASPGAVAEAATSLAALRAAVAPYQVRLAEREPRLAAELQRTFAASLAYLRRHPQAEAFDQLAFLTDYANPLSRQLARAQLALGIRPFAEVRTLRADAATLFDPAAFNPMAFAPNTTDQPTAAQAALGRQLFFDTALSGNGSRSCASCHRPERAFTDGQVKSVAFGGQGQVARNAPTLLNAALQSAQFYDGRVTYLEDQAAAVLADPREMHGSLAAAVRGLAHKAAYRAAFARAFPATRPAGIQEQHLKTALASYLRRELLRCNAPFDRYVRGEKQALDPAARRGFNVFMGKGRCGTCHFMPLFNGTVPPAFERTEAEVLGVPAHAARAAKGLDHDPGRQGVSGIEWQRHAFKTPTLRNVALTAPYMHNGAYRTLAEVIDFYAAGGGAGLGLAVPNQTLPAGRIDFTAPEKRDLLAFLQALTDTTGLSHARPRPW